MTAAPASSAVLHHWSLLRWLAWSLLPLLFLGVALWVQSQPVLPAHRALFLQLNQSAQVLPPALWSMLTLLGDAGVLFALLSPLLLMRPQLMLAVIAAVPLGGLFSVLFKRLFDAPRPAAVLDLAQFHLIGPLLSNHSFPSGHTISAFAAAGALLATVVPTGKLTSPSSTAGSSTLSSAVWAVIILGLAALVGLSRVAVGAHWPVDVLAGASGGWLAGLSGAAVARRFPSLWNRAASQHWMCGALLGVAVWLLWHPVEYPLGAVAVRLAVICVVVTAAAQIVAWARTG